MQDLKAPVKAFTRSASPYLPNIAVRPRCANRSGAQMREHRAVPAAQMTSGAFRDTLIFMNPLLDHISVDPKVCGGKPCIKGTRIWISLVLEFLAEGVREEEILADYPQLTPEDIRACIAYAAEIARERIVPVSVKPAA